MRRVVMIVMAGTMLTGCDRVREIVRPGATEGITLPPPLPDRDARPVLAVLENDAVFVDMDDGTQCLGASGAALSSAGWSGTLRECPYGYSYQVELAAGTLPDRVFLEPRSGSGLVDEDSVPFRPLVRLSITDFLGTRHVFESEAGF